MKHNRNKFKIYFLIVILSVLPIAKAQALNICSAAKSVCCDCDTNRENLVNEFDRHRREFFLGTFWGNTVHPGLRTALNNIMAAVVSQSASLGGFIDAQNNVNTLQALQKSQAKTVSAYLPSEQVCRFGSISQSLAADDARAKSNQLALAKIGLARNLGADNTAGAAGASGDRNARNDQFCAEYADEQDNNNGLGLMCGASATRTRKLASVALDTRYNRDINYTATIEAQPTLQMDFTKAPASDRASADQQDVIMLGHNLYGSTQLSERSTARDLQNSNTQLEFLKTRGLYASRAVAQNSYAAIAGQRARGSGGSALFVKSTLKSLGLPEAQVKALISDNPSYFAQMEILTKKLYQSPAFYVNLMDSKTNVERQTESMEGLQLMQDRDVYKSARRSEMLLALLVQLEARRTLEKTARDINTPMTVP